MGQVRHQAIVFDAAGPCGWLRPSMCVGAVSCGNRGASPLMIDFMSHFTESILCNAISSSPGFRGDRAEFPSPAMGDNVGGDRTGASAKS